MAASGGVIIAAATVGSVIEQRNRAKRVEDKQETAANVEVATRAEEARVSRRQQIREARVRQGEVENIAASTNQQGSSAAVAAGDDLSANLASNVGRINTGVTTGALKSKAEQDIFDANRKSGLEILSGAALNFAS